MSTPPGILQFKREDFPSSGLTTLDALDKLFLPLNQWLDQARIALTHGIDLTNNTIWELKTVKVVTPATDWVTFTLAGSWVANSGPTAAATPAVRKDAGGAVYLSGTCTGGLFDNATALGTLPTAYWPYGSVRFFAGHSGAAAGGSSGAGFKVQNADGKIIPRYGAVGAILGLDSVWDAADRTPIPLTCFPVDFTLQRVQSPSGLLLIGCRDITTPGNGGPSSDPPIALGTPKWTLLQSNKVRLQNLSGLLLGRAYQLTFLALK